MRAVLRIGRAAVTHDDAMEKLTHAAELVAEVRAAKHGLRLDMLGRFALQDAGSAIDRAQAGMGRAMRERQAVRQ